MKTIRSIDQINHLTKNDFIDIFGNVFEKTYWIADKAYNLKPYKNINELLSTIFKIYDNCPEEDCLKIFMIFGQKSLTIKQMALLSVVGYKRRILGKQH